jgi:hypothetical protein
VPVPEGFSQKSEPTKPVKKCRGRYAGPVN